MADDNKRFAKEFEIEVKRYKKVLSAGTKEFRQAVSSGLEKAGLVIEDEATERCPKYTGQLSLTIGHYRVDSGTQKLAKEHYGKAAGPEAAIWRKPKWNELELGTGVEYAAAVHSRIPFLTDALAAKTGEIIQILSKEVKRRMDKKFKF